MGKILYNFIKYPTPKKGLFSIEKKMENIYFREDGKRSKRRF
jgi:hypothetical protein